MAVDVGVLGMTALVSAFWDWLAHCLDRASLALMLWLCGSPDAPWSAEA